MYAGHWVLHGNQQTITIAEKELIKMCISRNKYSAGLLVLVVLTLYSAACSKAPTDEEMAQALQAKFYTAPELKNASITVAVAKGEATLSGEVASDALHWKALELAGVTPGIKKVNDQITVKTLVTIPAGTEIQVKMIDAVNSKSSRVNSLFRSSLHVPITSADKVVIPQGADVYIRLVTAKSAGSIKGSSVLEVVLDHVVVQGQSIPLSSRSVRLKSASRGEQTAKRTVVGGAAGAIVGGIFGGGRGAAIGAGVGAGGTLAYQALTKGPEVRIPSQSRLDFTLAEPFQVPVEPNNAQ
jgi:hypothetical protein